MASRIRTKKLKAFLATVAVVPILIPLLILSIFSFNYASLLASNCLIFGKVLRRLFYTNTLKSVGKDLDVHFGVIFSSRDIVIGDNVRIGSFSTIDRCLISSGCQIAQNVLILSSSSQHKAEFPHLFNSEHPEQTRTTIGKHCWIGAGSIIMNNIGTESVIAAGSVVNRPIESYALAAGNPATVKRRAYSQNPAKGAHCG